MAERFQNGSVLLMWTLPPEVRDSDRLTVEVNWGQGWVQVAPGLHSPANLEHDREYEVQFRLRHGQWEGMANVTVPRAPPEGVVEEGDSPAEVAVLYIVIFGSVVVICAVLLTVVLGLKYVQGKHRDADKGEGRGWRGKEGGGGEGKEGGEGRGRWVNERKE